MKSLAKPSSVFGHRGLGVLLGLLAAAVLASCGGGGGGGSSSSPPVTVNVAPLVVDAGPTLPANYACSTADSTLGGCTPGSPIYAVNTPYVSVKVCLPGTNNCMTIDHVSVDTGSSGLRLQYGAIANLTSTSGNSGSNFFAAMPTTANQTGNATAECVQFGSGYTFGPVVNLDVYVMTGSGTTYEKSAGVNVQIAGGTTASTTDVSGASNLASCEAGLPSMNDIYAMGGNGLIGVGLFVNDCVTGQTCPSGLGVNMYYNCTSAGCQEASVNATQQVANPVATAIASDTNLATDTNGVILSLPTVASMPVTVASNAPPPSISGSLLFGVGTRTNNTPGSTVLTAGYQNSALADFANINVNLSTTSGSSAYPYTGTGTTTGTYSPYSFIDSGSNAYFIPALNIACDTAIGGWFTPSSTLTYNLTLAGSPDPNVNNRPVVQNQATTTLTIANASTLFNTGNIAYSSLAAPSASCSGGMPSASASTPNSSNMGIDLGLPFFYGRSVAVVNEISHITQGTTTYYGPLWAF